MDSGFRMENFSAGASPAIRDFVLGAWPVAGSAPNDFAWTMLAGDGSDRGFYRICCDEHSAVLVVGPDRRENMAYEFIGRHLWRLGRWGPEIFAADHDSGLCLIEDLGRDMLQVLAADLAGDRMLELFRPVVALLADVHDRGLDGFDTRWCYQTVQYDRTLILERETGYFLSAFVRGYLGLDVNPAGLACEFEALAEAALGGDNHGLMHRDFQSRNVMVKDARPRLMDFQGARLGPAGYDLASSLFDPYVALTTEMRTKLFNYYLEVRQGRTGFPVSAFLQSYPYLAACRLLQALGAFGHLTRVKGKGHFEKYIPVALSRLAELIRGPEFNDWPLLRGLIERLTNKMEVAL